MARLLSAAALAVVAASGAAHAQAPLNTNGSFEDTAPGPADAVEGWALIAGDDVDPAPTFSVSEDAAFDGDRSLRVAIDAVGPEPYSIQVVAEGIPVTPDGSYQYSIRARTESGTATANFTVGNSSYQEYGRAGDVSISDQWSEIAFEFTIGDDETVARAPIHLSFSANVGDVIYLDDLRVTEVVTVFEPTGPPLGEGLDRFVGLGIGPSQQVDYEYYWNQLTPGNAGKWGSVEGTRDQMNWDELDTYYELAQTSDLPFRFHVLVWGNQQPGWIAALPPDEQLAEIREWFEAVAARYPDIDYLEVVNEPLHDPPDSAEDGGYIEALGGAGDTGWDWVITAFEMARETFPAETRLMINDYNILGSSDNTSAYLDLVELLQARDLIDGIGVQGHAFSTRGSASSLTATLDALATTGLPIQITEFDVDGNPNASPSVTEAQSDQTQRNEIERIFPALWEHPAVEGVTFWGWRPGLWRNEQEAYLVRSNGEERPALVWLREYLQRPTAAEDAPAGPVVNLRAAPNPVAAATRVLFDLAEPADVTLRVYDAVGREVATLLDAPRGAGSHSVSLDASGLAPGVYLVRLHAGPHAHALSLVRR